MKKGKLDFVGLGLFDEKDISLKALESIKKSDKVFAEFYTAKLTGTNLEKIEEKVGKKIQVLSRQETEKGDILLNSAKNYKTVFLTCGDPMTATTHVDLRIRAIDLGVDTRVIHGSSIISAVPGLLGLQNYKFGRSTTLVIPEGDYFPTSPYDVIKNNKKNGLHTMVLLDIQADKNVLMTADKGIQVLLNMEKKIDDGLLNEDNLVCVVARAGSDKPFVRADSFKALKRVNFGPPLHTIVIPGSLHFMEVEALVKLAGLPTVLAEKLQKI